MTLKGILKSLELYVKGKVIIKTDAGVKIHINDEIYFLSKLGYLKHQKYIPIKHYSRSKWVSLNLKRREIVKPCYLPSVCEHWKKFNKSCCRCDGKTPGTVMKEKDNKMSFKEMYHKIIKRELCK